MNRVVIFACSALLAVAVGCGSEAAVNADAKPGPDQWSPPEGRADIAGLASAVTPSDPAGDGCVARDPKSQEKPVSSDDPRTCGSPASARIGTVLIEGGTGRYGSATIAVDDETVIRRRIGTGYEKVGLSALAAGSRLEVWFEGPVAESFPVQTTAGTIVVGP